MIDNADCLSLRAWIAGKQTCRLLYIHQKDVDSELEAYACVNTKNIVLYRALKRLIDVADYILSGFESICLL